MALDTHNIILLVLSLLLISILSRKCITYLTYRHASNHQNYKPAPQIPQWDRLIGYSLFKESSQAVSTNSVLQLMTTRFQKYGTTFSGVLMGQSFIMTIEPENIKAVLATNFRDFGIRGRLESFGPLLGNGIFTSDGVQWEHSRALIRPAFVKAQIADLGLYETHFRNLLSLLPTDGRTVDLQPLFFRLTLDSATEYLFGSSVNSLHNSEGPEKDFAIAIDYALSQIPQRYRRGALTRFLPDRKFHQACKTVHAYTDRFVQSALAAKTSKEKQRVEEGGQRYTLLHELAKATSDPIQLRHELLNMLIAGRDTTASLLSNLFFVLARRPDVWQRLRGEVDELGGRKPDYEALRRMKYLRNVLNEALRLYPVVPANSRFATRNTTLPRGGGSDGTSPIFITKGQIVAYSVFNMHRRDDIYGLNAEEFDPDRWNDLRPGWAYIPFNGGPRICLGQQFALTEIGYVTVRLVQSFGGIEARGEREWVERLGVTLSSFYGVEVGLYE
ncbi:hypothetical protein HYFRA_00007388 [Hymenoscyphus fraxineus]|uniref:Cytochrome P450 alkane hydroxylase n=1 Tax=Hymenoscyphus fraxineus TaxID=746836 RepID=A0A9N9PRH1_9HELO|nr:hypothetical protein HYFRA_00007388 [Hymenoscyphus fraxineus]